MARVLLVEPEPELRMLAEESLREIGHEAVLPREADAGVPVDIVMTVCCDSPGATGLAAAWARLPLVCVGDEPVADERRCGMSSAYLLRPYSLDALSGALERALADPAAR